MGNLKGITRCPDQLLIPGWTARCSSNLQLTPANSAHLHFNTPLKNGVRLGPACFLNGRLRRASRQQRSPGIGQSVWTSGGGIRADLAPQSDGTTSKAAASVPRKWEEIIPETPKPGNARLPLSEITQALAAAALQKGGKKWEEDDPPQAKEEAVPATPPKPSIPKSRLAAIIAGEFSSREEEIEDFSGGGNIEGSRRSRNEDERSQRGPRFFVEREPAEVDPAVREQQIAAWLGRHGLNRRKTGLASDEVPSNRKVLTESPYGPQSRNGRSTDWRQDDPAQDMRRGRRAGHESAIKSWSSSSQQFGDAAYVQNEQSGRPTGAEYGRSSDQSAASQEGRSSHRERDSWGAERRNQWESDSWQGLAMEAAEGDVEREQSEGEKMQSRHTSKGRGSFLRRVPTVEMDRESWLLGGRKPNSTERIDDPLRTEALANPSDQAENEREGLVGEASELIGKRDFVRVKLPKDNLDPVDAADLHQAIMQRDFARIWWLVERKEVDVNQLDDHVLGYFTTALHIACEIGDPVMVSRLLEKGARADTADEFGRFPIVSALIGKERVLTKVGIIETLLTTGVSIEQRNPVNGKYPIHYAVAGPNDLIVYLRDKGADLNVKDLEGKTPLHDSLDIQDPSDPAWKNMEYLLGLGAKPNAKDKEGRTALHIAAQRHEYVRCKELLRWKALVHVRDKQGRTPMRYVRPQPYGEDSIISLFQRFGGKL